MPRCRSTRPGRSGCVRRFVRDLPADGSVARKLGPGAVFGRYVLTRSLGSGGMGAVYEATHVDLKKRVAIKTLLPEVADNEQARARFLREGEAVARLRHPNVVDITDVGFVGEVPYLVMELLDGEDLGHLLDRQRVIPLDALVDLMLPVLDAVSAAHEVGVVHRDLKPENIFLARTRHAERDPKLLDFGISKVGDLGTGKALTATNTMMGTTVYMSPEQAQNSKDVDARTDQYSLGVILYEASTGRHPFEDAAEGDSLFALLSAIVGGRFAPPRVVRQELPEAFERVVLRAMATRRADRFHHVHDMARALLPFAGRQARMTWAARLGEAADAETPMPVASPVADLPLGGGDRGPGGTLLTGRPLPTDTEDDAVPRFASRHRSTLGALAQPVEVPAPAAPTSPARRAPAFALGLGVVALLAGGALIASRFVRGADTTAAAHVERIVVPEPPAAPPARPTRLPTEPTAVALPLPQVEPTPVAATAADAGSVAVPSGASSHAPIRRRRVAPPPTSTPPTGHIYF